MSTATYSADPPRLHTGQGECRKRTAIYCRVSTPGQKHTTSLPEQERINRAHATTLGWQVSEPHVYREVEGDEDLYRPCMVRLWDAMQAHEIDGVVIDRKSPPHATPLQRQWCGGLLAAGARSPVPLPLLLACSRMRERASCTFAN